MNPTPEQLLQRFCLPDPSPELRARVFAAARQEWNALAPASEWAPLQRSLLAIAAALVVAFAGSWINQRLTATASAASTRPAAASQIHEWELAGLPAPFPVSLRTAGAAGTAAALQARHDQLIDLLHPARIPSTPPNGQSRWRRQNSVPAASCC